MVTLASDNDILMLQNTHEFGKTYYFKKFHICFFQSNGFTALKVPLVIAFCKALKQELDLFEWLAKNFKYSVSIISQLIFITVLNNTLSNFLIKSGG